MFGIALSFLSVLGGLSLTHQYLKVTDRSFSLLLILGVSVSPQTVENENQSTLNISHKALWSQNIQRSSDSSSTCSSQLSSSEELENEVEVRPKYKIYGESTWKDVPCEKVKKIPNNVDGLKHYVVKDKSRSSLLAKCKDGRKWKRDSCTKWSGYDSVRYQNCAGSFYCPNVDCYYFQEYYQTNCVHADKKGDHGRRSCRSQMRYAIQKIPQMKKLSRRKFYNHMEPVLLVSEI